MPRRHVTSADLLITVDAQGRCLDASPAVREFTRLDASEIVGSLVSGWFAEDDLDTLRFLVRRLARESALRTTVRLRVASTGQSVWLDVAAESLAAQSAADDVVMVVSARDVTDETLAMHQLLQSEQQWRLSFDHSPIGAAILDDDLTVRSINDTLARMIGRRADDIVGCSINDFTVAGELAFDGSYVRRVLETGEGEHEFDLRLEQSDGETLWGQATIAAVPSLEGGVHGLMLQVLDVTARRTAELELANRALHDPLTSLPNRNLIHQWLASALEEHLGRDVGVLYCDLDRFKVVNDSLGHAIGDDLLVEVAERLTTAVRPEDFVGRIGGDEFVVVLERIGQPADLLHVARRIAEAFDKPFILAGHQHMITPSVGAAVGRSPDTPDDLLVRADLALLRAKRSGRARVEIFDAATDRVTTLADLEFEAQLRRSVDADQLRAHYQPVVALQDRTLAGVEALVRWQHPDLGLLGPERFLPLAENSGVIRSLGWWMLFRACHDAASGKFGDGWVSVNVSANQLNRPGFADLVREATQATKLDPSRLHLEITETALLEASPHVVGELRSLRVDGIGIVLDDFGTGFSSLSLLRDLPVSTVKIDRSFVDPLLVDRSAAAIVRAVLSMCADLGLPTIAEGVEDEAQVEQLLALGCTHAQGFLFGHPLGEGTIAGGKS